MQRTRGPKPPKSRDLRLSLPLRPNARLRRIRVEKHEEHWSRRERALCCEVKAFAVGSDMRLWGQIWQEACGDMARLTFRAAAAYFPYESPRDPRPLLVTGAAQGPPA